MLVGRMWRLPVLVCVSLTCLAVGLRPAAASGEELSSSLTVAGSPTEAEQIKAEEEASSSNPEVRAQLSASASAYEGLSVKAAERLVGEVFPHLVDEPAGGLPKLPEGERVEAYVGTHAARISLADGRSGVLESVRQIAVRGPNGGWAPIDLGLEGSQGGGYRAKRSAVPVRLPVNLGEGVSLPGVGVSLTPLVGSGSGVASARPGNVDGYAVFWGASSIGPDVDVLGRLIPAGVDLLTVLRSARSPEMLRYRVGMPSGARLVQVAGSGMVEVVDDGHAIGMVAAPEARDAQGRAVPLSVKVEGDVLTLMVEHRAGGWAFPLVVDPYVKADEQLTYSGKPTRWKFGPVGAAHFTSSSWDAPEIILESTGWYLPGETGFLSYQAQGEAKIYEATVWAAGANEGNMETYFQMASSKGVEDTHEIAHAKSSFPKDPFGVCASYGSNGEPDCNTPYNKYPDEYGTPDNWVHLALSSTGEGSARNYVDVSSATVSLAQEHEPEEPKFNTGEEHLTKDAGRLNVLYGKGSWLGPYQGGFEVSDKDPGIGISYFDVSTGGFNILHEFYEAGKCEGVICSPEVNEIVTYNKAMADGEDNIEVTEKDLAMKGAYGPVGQARVKVDGTAPHNLTLYGLPSGDVIDETPYHLRAEAMDGSGSAPSSGVRVLALKADGVEINGKNGSCTPGPCTAVGEWTLNGEELGAGTHVVELVATDNAGNEETKPFEVTVRHASPLSVGPATVDPITGSATLEASDVSIGGGFGTLGVSRSYNSRQLTAGEGGSLGPQWSLSISGEQGVESEPTGDVTLVADDGSRTIFTSNGKGGFVSPKGDENLVLSAEWEGEAEKSKVKAYLLKDPAKGTTSRFIHPGGASATNLWVIEKSEGALSATNGEKEMFKWEVAEGVERPKEALAPAPTGVSCEPEPRELKELKVGCRALGFVYAKETTATGETPSEWSEYKNRLKEVTFTAYDPSVKAMVTKPVADYLYDNHGRLRAEWDPRLEKKLTTTYGYDLEGHVVADDSPGVEPCLLHYGALSGDSATGRLLSVIRPPASTKLESGPVPVASGSPTLSTASPVIGTTVSVSSNGSWNNGPLAYEYLWEDCNSKGEACKAIPGAVNQAYTPQASDAGYTLVATVTALNGDGAGVASTAASGLVPLTAAKYAAKWGALGTLGGQFKNPIGVAVDGSGNVWVADHNNDRIEKFTSTGAFVEAIGWGVENGEAKLEVCTLAANCRAGLAGSGNGELSLPDGVAVSGEALYIADAGNNRIEQLNTKGEFVRSFGSAGSMPGQMQNPVAVAVTPTKDVWVADRSNNRIDQYSETGGYLGSFGTVGTAGGQFKEPSGIAFSGEYAYVVDAGNGRVQQLTLSGSYVGQFGSAGTGAGQFSQPGEIATESVSGDLFVADSGNSRIEEFNPAGTLVATIGSSGEAEGQFKGIEGVAATSSGGLYAADLNGNRIQEFAPAYSTSDPAPEPPSVGAYAVSTLAYRVPVSGAGAPYQMGAKEVETGWAQKDLPVEATAVLPPDEPMGWPAKEYKKATITYLDDYGRAVNTAAPTGGISTREYNLTNDVTRTLSAANRAIALKEGSKSAEAAQKLDTESSYNKEGTELLETLGPEHKVKLFNGEEVNAREHTRYLYDEGAPSSGRPYNLLTRTIDGAQIAGRTEEADVRVTKTSYSGQEGLGWKLRRPTNVTTDPNNGTTGAVTSVFGSYGSAPGQFNAPHGLAVGPNGDVYVVDTKNNRVEKFTPKGEYLSEFGQAGTGAGELSEPEGIAIAADGNVYVADAGHKMVKEFSEGGSFVARLSESRKVLAVAVANGYVYVLRHEETGNHLVGVYYESTGALVREECTERLESLEQEYMQKYAIMHPQGIAVYKSTVYVSSDELTGGILKFTSNGHCENVQDIAPNLKEEEQIPGDVYQAEGLTVLGTVLYAADTGHDRVKEYATGGGYLAQYGSEGTSTGQLKEPADVAVAANGNMYVADTANNRIEMWNATSSPGVNITHATVYDPKTGAVAATRSPAAGAGQEGSATYVFRNAFGGLGSATGQFNNPHGVAVSATGDVYVVDTKNNRVEVFTPKGEYLSEFGQAGSGAGELSEPEGIAVAANGNVYVADAGHKVVKKFSETGTFLARLSESRNDLTVAISNGYVYVLRQGETGDHLVGVYSESSGALVREECTERLESTEQEHYQKISIPHPQGIAVYSGVVYISNEHGILGFTTNGMCEGPGFLVPSSQEEGSKPSAVYKAEGLTVAEGDVYVADTGHNRIKEYTTTGTYLAQYGSEGAGNGQLKEPGDLAISAGGDMYIADTANNRAQWWTPPGEDAPPTRTIYYTAGEQAGYPQCSNHPEWANLPCQTGPAYQPDTTGVPALPVKTVTYNVWDEPEKVEEAFGSTVRTSTTAYDAAGRKTGTAVTGSVGESLPSVAYRYDEKTGALVEESQTVGERVETIKTEADQLGRLVSYGDAGGATTSFSYEEGGDGRLVREEDSKGYETYAYDPTTGLLTKLLDSAAATFTASYDVEGKIVSETYPNGMTAGYATNSIGQATGIAYEKTTNCSEKCLWYTQTVSPSIHGETLYMASTLANDSMSYDTAGRLTQVLETPAGGGCKTRIYSYDIESNRTSLTSRAPTSEGGCSTEGGSVESHSYDEASRLTDAGVEYDQIGDITRLPAADAGGQEVKSSYYTTGQLYTQTQNEETLAYGLDPTGRILETEKKTKAATTISVSHYAGAGDAVSWTSEKSGEAETWTRNIPGIDGSLCATETSAGNVTLQLHDLQGDIVATTGISGTETKLQSSYNSTEFGVPTTSSPPKYSWLGAAAVPTELPSGITNSSTISYVPELGRTLQTEPVIPPGAYPSGSYTGAPYTTELSPESVAQGLAYGAEAPGREAARQKEAEQEAEEKAEAEFTIGPAEDPTGILWWKASEERAKMFHKWAIDIEEALVGREADIGSGMTGLLYEDGQYEEQASKELLACAHKVKKFHPMGVCWLTYEHEEFDWPFVATFELLKVGSFKVEECTWLTGHRRKHEWFHCPSHGNYAG